MYHRRIVWCSLPLHPWLSLFLEVSLISWRIPKPAPKPLPWTCRVGERGQPWRNPPDPPTNFAGLQLTNEGRSRVLPCMPESIEWSANGSQILPGPCAGMNVLLCWKRLPCLTWLLVLSPSLGCWSVLLLGWWLYSHWFVGLKETLLVPVRWGCEGGGFFVLIFFL